MPYTPRQTRYLMSGGSPLTSKQKAKMKAELHANPALAHRQKGDVESYKYNFRRKK